MTNLQVCCDTDLAAAFEGAEAAACRAFCTAAAEVHPGAGVRVVEAAGGVGLLYGPADPLNSVKGAGLSGPVNMAQWDALERAFLDTRSSIVIDLCPLADEAFVAKLTERGYRIAAFETVTFRSLSVSDSDGAPVADPAVRVSEILPADIAAIAAWKRVLDVAFADGGEPIKFAIDFGRVRAFMAARESPPSTFMLLATVNGIPAGGAALSFARAFSNGDSPRPRIALMSGAAVLPEYRGRGIQSALTRARMNLARRERCDYATICVKAGSSSHRNAARAGFQVAYTRPQLVLAAPAGP